MSDLKEKLIEIGLSAKESEVYITLLKIGPISGGDLAKQLNMDRTHIYNISNNLINKGLVSYIQKENKRLFQATSPTNLLNIIEQRKLTIKSIVPELLSLEKVKPVASKVNVLEGKEGVRVLIRLLFESKVKNICVYGATGKSYQALKYEMEHIGKETNLEKIKGRLITGKKLRGKMFTKLKNFEIKYIEELTPASTMIFGDRVSITIFDEKIFVILIESKAVADSYREYFEYLWKIANY